ncbi:MAG TPA: hypothetical protein VK040_10390 [Balneolaceae bacterium]|nr:hypothetical protein [Balneolaceae bacterium]
MKGYNNVYTNTRFTSDAIQYGKCVGLLLTSWDYPRGNGLKDRIDKSGLHPLTALTTLTKAEKTKLLDEGIVLCKELHGNPVSNEYRHCRTTITSPRNSTNRNAVKGSELYG